jgi:hypothetical protein
MSQPQPKGYVCYRAPEPIILDGDLEKPVWQAAAWTDDFVDIQGESMPAPRFRTRARLLWDDRFLYIGAELEEPHVWGTLTERDSVIFYDNDFEVFIDPDGDNHDYYEIEINALNTVWDLRLPKPYRDGGPALNEWDIPGLQTAVKVHGTLNDPQDRDRGWTIEMACPWAALGEYARCPAPPKEGDQWRINFSRVEWEIVIEEGRYRKVEGRPEDNWVWSPQGVIDMHRPERWGYVQFTSAAPGSAVFRPDPSAEARNLLHQVYYAQREFHALENRYAVTLSELEQNLPVTLALTPEGYQVSAAFHDHDGSVRLIHIRQDSRVWL